MDDRRRPRVLMLTSTLPRWEGDSEPRFVLDLARHLSDDIDVELLAPHAPGAARQEVLESVAVTRFRYWIPRWQSVAYEGGITWRMKENPLRLFQVPLFLWSMAWHVVRRLWREPRIDLIHAHWIIPQGLVAVLVRGLTGRKVAVVTTSHGGDLFGLRGRFWTMLKRTVLRESDAVTVVSSAMADVARGIVSDIDPVVVPMGTDLRKLFVPPAKPRSTTIRNLVFVGRLVEKKGVTYLLQAFRIVADKYPELRLNIVGDGPLRPALEAEARRLSLSKIVFFLGAIPHARLPEHYQAAEVAVFPFVEAASGDQEGFGLVMVEAMGCGCVVVAAELPAIRDVVRNGLTGVLVRPGSPDALAHAIFDLVEDSSAAMEMSMAGQEFAVRNFDWTVSSDKFGRMFQELAGACASNHD